ncbi:MAG TPA: TspO/MBR family protein [Thermoanaerobaculia bacterium]|nr:TspO/MBR family protein [Thermoanaerobaculia bacterium]
MTPGFGLRLLVFGALCAATAAIGGRFTTRGLGPWYDDLAKPSWTPSGAVIGGVWTLLFAMIAVASAIVWGCGRPLAYALALGVNLALNAGWSYLFFARRAPAAALPELVILELTCIALVLLAWPASRLAAGLLLPYVVWVAFAGFLNGRIVRLNA